MTEPLLPIGVLEDEILCKYYSKCKTVADVCQKIKKQKSILYVNFFWIIIHAAHDENWTINNPFLAGRIYETLRKKIQYVDKKIKSITIAINSIEIFVRNYKESENKTTFREVISNSIQLKEYDEFEKLKNCTREKLPQFFEKQYLTNMLYDFIEVISKNPNCITDDSKGLDPYTIGQLDPYTIGQLKVITDRALSSNNNLIKRVQIASAIVFKPTLNSNNPQTNPQSNLELFFDLVTKALAQKELNFLFRLFSKLEIPHTIVQNILLNQKSKDELLKELNKTAASYIVTLDSKKNTLNKMNRKYNEISAHVKINASAAIEINHSDQNSLTDMFFQYETIENHLWDKLINHVSQMRGQIRWSKLFKQLAKLPIPDRFKLYFISPKFDLDTLEDLHCNQILSNNSQGTLLKIDFESIKREMPIQDKFHLYQICNKLLQGSPSSSYSSSPPSSASNISLDFSNQN